MGNVSSNEPILSNWNQPNRLANRSGKIIAYWNRWSSNQDRTMNCDRYFKLSGTLIFVVFTMLQCTHYKFGLIYRITNFLI